MRADDDDERPRRVEWREPFVVVATTAKAASVGEIAVEAHIANLEDLCALDGYLLD